MITETELIERVEFLTDSGGNKKAAVIDMDTYSRGRSTTGCG